MTETRNRMIPEGMVARAIAVQDGAEIPGRRGFGRYFELGVEEASQGLVSTQVTKMSGGMSEETGWHYHDCDFQWLYVVKGWLELQFENGEKKRIEENGICFIPGGYRHNETAIAEELEFVEIFMPPNPTTVPVDSPL